MSGQYVTRQEVIAEARTWIGTRWHHQGRMRGVGVDCAGLVIGVARSLGLSEFDVANYSRIPSGGLLRELCAANMRLIARELAADGDVYLMRFEREPQHLAIRSTWQDMPSIIHAYADVRRVVEHVIDDEWLARIVGAFHIPGVE